MVHPKRYPTFTSSRTLYISAYDGRAAERLHRTLMDKARAMQCAPPAKKVNGSADFYCSSDEIANNTSQVRYYGLRDNYSQLDGHANSSFGQ